MFHNFKNNFPAKVVLSFFFLMIFWSNPVSAADLDGLASMLIALNPATLYAVEKPDAANHASFWELETVTSPSYYSNDGSVLAQVYFINYHTGSTANIQVTVNGETKTLINGAIPIGLVTAFFPVPSEPGTYYASFTGTITATSQFVPGYSAPATVSEQKSFNVVGPGYELPSANGVFAFSFNLDKDVYDPGETIRMDWAAVLGACNNSSYSAADLIGIVNGESKNYYISSLSGNYRYSQSWNFTAPTSGGTWPATFNGATVYYEVDNPCTVSSACAWNTCLAPGSTCSDSCGNIYNGLKTDGVCCTPDCSNAPNVCSGVSYSDGCVGTCNGGLNCYGTAYPGDFVPTCSAGEYNVSANWYADVCSTNNPGPLGTCNFAITAPLPNYLDASCGTDTCESTDVWYEKCVGGDIWEYLWGKDDECVALYDPLTYNPNDNTYGGCDSDLYYECTGSAKLKTPCEVGYTCKASGTTAECIAKSATWTEI